jgi:hypothetical protein
MQIGVINQTSECFFVIGNLKVKKIPITYSFYISIKLI